MSTLRELMRDVADDQPVDGLADVATLAELGRRRVRRRRTTIALAAAVVVALVVTPFAIRAASGPEPVSPYGKVIRLDRAVPGVAGVDYTVLSSVTSRMLDAGPGHLGVEGTLPDGRLVVARLVGPHRRTTGLGVLQPTTGTVAWFPFRRVGLYQGHDGDLLVYGTRNWNGNNLNTAPDRPYQVFDLATGAWHALPADRTVDLEWGGSRQEQVVSDGMLYVGLDTEPTRTLMRVPLDGSSGWTQVGTVGAFGVGAGTLAAIRSTGADPGALTLQDLGSGQKSSYPLSRDPGCQQRDLAVSTAYVVRTLSCGRPQPGQTNRLLILDHHGTPLASVSAGYLELASVTGNVVVFSVPDVPENTGYPPGTYAYHPATGRLVRLTGHDPVNIWPFLLPTDPVQLWRSGHLVDGRLVHAGFDVVIPH